MNREELMTILPHRDAMLLIDEASVVDGVAHGSYHVRGDEWFLRGHFPDNPVVPGVVLCEMLGQSVSVLLAGEVTAGNTPYFTGLDKVRFRTPVRPGDTLETECELTGVKKPFYFAKGKGMVNGKLAVSAEFSFAVFAEAKA